MSATRNVPPVLGWSAAAGFPLAVVVAVGTLAMVRVGATPAWVDAGCGAVVVGGAAVGAATGPQAANTDPAAVRPNKRSTVRRFRCRSVAVCIPSIPLYR